MMSFSPENRQRLQVWPFAVPKVPPPTHQLRLLGERPPRRAPGPDKKEGYAERKSPQTEKYYVQIRCCKDEHPSDERDHARNRIKPDSIRAWHLRVVLPEQHHSQNLTDKLNKNPGCDQCVNDHSEREEAARNRNYSDDNQRDVRKVLLRMKTGKYGKEIAVLCGSIRYARVAQQQREDRSESRPQNHSRKYRRHF